MVSPPAKVLFNVGVAALTVTQAPVVLVPLVALLLTEAVMLVSVPRLPLPLVLLACGHTPTVGLAAVVTSTVRVQVVAGLVIWLLVMVMLPLPATAVREPPPRVQVPPTFGVGAITSPAGKVSVKLKVWVGLLAGWVTVKVKVLVPPTVSVLPKALSTVGTAAVTVIQAPVVPPPELAMAAVRLAAPLIWPLPLVLAAIGQAAVLGVALLVTLTVMVQLVAGLVIW